MKNLENKTREELIKDLKRSNKRIAELEKNNIEITGLRKTKEALIASEERYRIFVDNASDAYYLTDKTGRFVDVNIAAIEMSGYSREELLSFSVLDIDSSFKSENVSEVFNNLLPNVSQKMESYHKRKNGEKFPVEVILRLFGSEDNPLVLAIARDISDRKQAEKELIAGKAKLESIFRVAPAGIGVVKDRILLEVNPVFCKMMGYTSKDLIGKKAIILYPNKKEYEYVGKEKYRQIAEKGTGTVETHFKKRNGEIIDVILSSSPIDLNDLSLGVTFTALDITDRKLAEDDLRMNEQNLSDLVENMLDGVAIIDENAKHIYVNSKFCEITGYSKEELANMTGWDYTRPEDLPVLKQRLKDRMSGKNEEQYYERIFLKKDGTEIPVEMSTKTTVWKGVKRPMAIIHDITNRKNAQKELEKYQKNLEELVKKRTNEIENQSKKLEDSQQALTFLLEDVNDARTKLEDANLLLELSNKELESFTYSVSHDLRAPLRSILGFSNKFSDCYGTQVDDEGKRLLNVIKSNTIKMSTLIDNLLSFSRMSRSELYKVKIDIKGLALETWNDQKDNYGDREIDLNIMDLPAANGDRNMLRQVLYNLLSNAAKFSKDKEISKIEVGFKMDNAETIYYVKDNGVGFDMKYIDKIFEVFQRLHSDSEFDGTGVGLAIVKRIITRHQGRVWAESIKDKKTTIFFTLPA